MESCLKQLSHRYVKYPDSHFSFSLLKSNNFFYLYLDTNNINGQLNFNIETKETSLNPCPQTKINIDTSKLSLNPSNIIFKTLFEGIWSNNTFYLTDIHIHNGIILNHNYKTRYFLLKKILEGFKNNDIFSLMKVFPSTTLEHLITEVIPEQKFKSKFILMQKDFMKYLLDVEEQETEKKTPEKQIDIEQYIEKPIKENCRLKIFKTQKTEIYLVEHKRYDFFTFGSFWKNKFEHNDVFYSVLRVKNIQESHSLKEKLKIQKYIEEECIYNPEFKKFELLNS